MTGDVIKSFLVSLGFGVDDSSLAKFNQALASAAIKVTALYASIQATASGIFFGISKIAEGFESIGYEYRIISPAINKALQLRQALLSAYKSAGINIVTAVQQSVKFNMSLAKTKYTLEAIYRSVGVKFLPLLTKQMEVFRKGLLGNMPKIQQALTKFIEFIFKLFNATVTLGERVWSILSRIWEFFVKLHDSTNGWSTAILGVIAAWKLLNLSFLATPFGILLTGLTSLLALYDDFKTFQEGGETLFDWGGRETQIVVGLVSVVGTLAAAFGGVVVALRAWAIAQGIINALLAINPIFAIAAAVTALIASLTLLIVKWDSVKKAFSTGGFGGVAALAGDSLQNVGAGILNFMGGGKGGQAFNTNVGENANNVGENVKNNPVGQPLASPVNQGNVNNNSNTQHVNQQTSIVVNGAANADATGKAVSGQQDKVNFNMTRNLRGSTR